MIVSSLIGTKTFTHFEYEKISSYLLINNKHSNVAYKERELVKMFSHNYRDLPDLG